MKLRVPNFAKYNPRDDVKNPSWIRLERNWYADDRFEGVGPLTLLVWTYVLGNASFQTSIASFQERIAVSSLNISRKDLLAAVAELLERGFVERVSEPEEMQQTPAHVSDAARARNASDTDTGVTERYGTVRNETDGTERTGTSASSPGDNSHTFGPRELAALWNAHAGPMHAQVDLKRFKSGSPRWRSAVARLADEPDASYWEEVVKRFAAWPHGRGETPGKGGGPPWVATFDFLLKPDTHVRAMEGQFERRGSPTAGRGDRDRGMVQGEEIKFVMADDQPMEGSP